MDEKYFEEQEIDIIDVFFRLLEQWRGLLVAGLVSVVVFTSVLTVKTYTVPQDAGTEMAEASNDGVVVDYKIVDTQTEYQQACTALSQYVDYLAVKQLFDTNIYNNIDFSDSNLVTCIFEFRSENSTSNLLSLSAIYSDINNDDDFTNKIAGKYFRDYNPETLYSILSVNVSANTNDSSSRSGTITLRATLPDDIDIDEWKETLTDALDDYDAKVEEMAGSHSLNLISYNVKKADSISNFRTQNTKISEVDTAKNTYQSTMAGLTEPTRELVNEIIEDSSGSYKLRDYSSKLESQWETYKDEFESVQERLYNEAVETAQKGSKGTSTINNEITNKAGLSLRRLLKYMILGFILGDILYAVVFMVGFILRRVIRNEDDFLTATGVKNFGGVYKYPYENRLQRFLHDEKIYRYRTRRGKTINEITEDISSKLGYLDTKEITVLFIGTLSEKAKMLCEEQIMDFTKNDIKVATVNIDTVKNNIRDSVFVSMKNAFIPLLGNQTKYSDMEFVYNKLKEYNIEIIGTEYIEV